MHQTSGQCILRPRDLYATELSRNTVRPYRYDQHFSPIILVYCMLITCIDLFRVANTEQELKQLAIPAESQPEGCADICFPSGLGLETPGAYVSMPVIQFERPNFLQNRVVLSMDYYHSYEFTIPDERQAISPRYVPSIESLLQAYLISRRNYDSVPSPFAGLYEAFRDFGESYCNTSGEMPLVRIKYYNGTG
jgi:hypothetical protein